jgi:hypothetical protein
MIFVPGSSAQWFLEWVFSLGPFVCWDIGPKPRLWLPGPPRVYFLPPATTSAGWRQYRFMPPMRGCEVGGCGTALLFVHVRVLVFGHMLYRCFSRSCDCACACASACVCACACACACACPCACACLCADAMLLFMWFKVRLIQLTARVQHSSPLSVPPLSVVYRLFRDVWCFS